MEGDPRRDRLRGMFKGLWHFHANSEWWHFDLKGWYRYPVLDVDFTALVSNCT
jgi:D-alanyl-D-alanine dipeptidase